MPQPSDCDSFASSFDSAHRISLEFGSFTMNRCSRLPADRPLFLLGRRHPLDAFVIAAALGAFVLTLAPAASAQYSPLPYSNYNWNDYSGMMNYNYDYSRFGLPGVGVSPWDPILQAQLNLGLKQARYNMYTAWANQAAGVANLYNQQAIAQAQQNAQNDQTMQPRYDMRNRLLRPAPPAQPVPKPLPRNKVLKVNGDIIWPSPPPSSDTLDKNRFAAEAAVRVAVKEFEANGKASVQSVAEAKSQLFAYGKPVLEQLARSNRAEAQNLLTFFISLEHVLDELAGE
jgi:hypothetical protein